MSSRKFIVGANFVLGIMVILAALLLIRDAISVYQPARAKIARPEKKTTEAAKRSFEDYAAVLKKNPFGFPGGDLKLLSASASGQSAAQPDVSLIGTIAGRPDVSYAIFTDTSGAQEIFRVGQQVYGLGRLKKVEAGRVIVSANGRNSEIELRDITMIKDVKGGAPVHTAFGRKTGDSSYNIDPQRIQQAIERPDQIMTDARFIPNMVNGKQQGFILAEVKPGGIYSSLGLLNGDVLTRINEHSISNPESALQAFTALRGIDRAQLDIIRNGARMTMTYSIR